MRTRWVGVQVITVTTMLAAFSAVFVMASTAGLSAYQRRRELALLRAVGATPRQVRRLLLGEAVGVGTVGAVAGAGLGLLLAPILGDLLVRAQLEPPGFAVRFAVLPLAVAVGTGILVALLGTWAASRRAARVSPIGRPAPGVGRTPGRVAGAAGPRRTPRRRRARAGRAHPGGRAGLRDHRRARLGDGAHGRAGPAGAGGHPAAGPPGPGAPPGAGGPDRRPGPGERGDGRPAYRRDRRAGPAHGRLHRPRPRLRDHRRAGVRGRRRRHGGTDRGRRPGRHARPVRRGGGGAARQRALRVVHPGVRGRGWRAPPVALRCAGRRPHGPGHAWGSTWGRTRSR